VCDKTAEALADLNRDDTLANQPFTITVEAVVKITKAATILVAAFLYFCKIKMPYYSLPKSGTWESKNA
jgi:hypothetical protein